MKRLYEFKEEDARDFARFVGIQAYTNGNNLHFKKCPYCGNTTSDKKTFAINLTNGTFHCLRASCGASGNMITLARDFNFSLGTQVDEYYRPRKQFRSLKTPAEPIQPKAEAIAFLESRGISENTARRYEITVQNDRPNILVFPFYDENGKLVSVKYRKTDFDKEKDSAKEWFEKQTKPILFGMKQCNPENKTLILTEGQMDSLAVAECGFENAVSVPTGAKGTTWIPYCWNWINKFGEIIVFGDHEKGNITLLDIVKDRFDLTVKHVREEDYKDCKDANEILMKYGKEQIAACIENAVNLPISQVVSLADVKDVDVYNWRKLQTGISQLDRLLYGGLPFGGVTLIAGKPGDGKSTLASQILINAAEQGYRCFAYSGELSNGLFKAWMNFQVAGSHAFEYQNKWGDKNYSISDMNLRIISEWYRDKIDMFDNSALPEDGTEKEDLLSLVEETIKQYGTKVVLIDNLMTALDLEEIEGTDKYEKQSRFVKKLTRIALRYDVLVLLVAHKRKNNFSTNANDEISGSGDIANLGMVTLAYDRDEDIDASQRKLKVAKNRLFGKTKPDGWIVDYAERSKRIYGEGDDPTADYSCFKEKDFDYVDMETPFDEV